MVERDMCAVYRELHVGPFMCCRAWIERLKLYLFEADRKALETRLRTQSNS